MPAWQQGLMKVYRDAVLRGLAAKNKTPRAIQTHREAVDLLEAYLTRKGMPTDPAAINRDAPHRVDQRPLVLVEGFDLR